MQSIVMNQVPKKKNNHIKHFPSVADVHRSLAWTKTPRINGGMGRRAGVETSRNTGWTRLRRHPSCCSPRKLSQDLIFPSAPCGCMYSTVPDRTWSLPTGYCKCRSEVSKRPTNARDVVLSPFCSCLLRDWRSFAASAVEYGVGF